MLQHHHVRLGNSQVPTEALSPFRIRPPHTSSSQSIQLDLFPLTSTSTPLLSIPPIFNSTSYSSFSLSATTTGGSEGLRWGSCHRAPGGPVAFPGKSPAVCLSLWVWKSLRWLSLAFWVRSGLYPPAWLLWV